MDSNESNATPSEDATGAEPPPATAGRDHPGAGAWISPITLDAARAVYRHYADRLAARRMPHRNDDA